MLSITKIYRFESAHAITSHDGLCRNIHGHSYELHTTVTTNKLNKSDMVIDFKELNKLVDMKVVKEFDHALILKNNEFNQSFAKNCITKIFWMEQEPTVEMLIKEIVQRIQLSLPDQIKLIRVKLFETNSSYAEWSL